MEVLRAVAQREAGDLQTLRQDAVVQHRVGQQHAQTHQPKPPGPVQGAPAECDIGHQAAVAAEDRNGNPLTHQC